MTPVVLDWEVLFIQTSPRTVGFADGYSVIVVPLWNDSAVTVPAGLPKKDKIAFVSASLFFKSFQIHRAFDAEKNVLVYTVVSTKLINGSPFNSISVVPVGAP